MESDPVQLDDAAAKKPRRSIAGILATALIAIFVLLQTGEVATDKQLRTFWGHIFGGTTAEFTRSWKDHGELLNQIAPTGNVVVLYRAFDPGKIDQVNYAAQSHFLGEYQIYPRRVYTGDEKALINKGPDVLNPTFEPSMEWLWRNDVHIVATYQMSGQNQLQVSTANVPPPPQQGGR